MSKIYKPEISKDKENELWDNAIIVFDTSALCRFYSLTKDARLKLIQLLSDIHFQIWLPNRVSVEFNRHKNEERQKPLGKYQLPDFIKSDHFESKFKDFIKKLKGEQHKHPFVPEHTLGKWENLLDEYHHLSEKIRVSIDDTLKSQKENYKKELENDEIDEFVSSLEVGNNLDWTHMMEIVKEGTWRYVNKIPPGYMDDQDKASIDKYGDLLIWKEIIEEAAKKERDVILITQDLKEDWNSSNKPDSIVPREELFKEFKDLSGKTIWMYTISDFLKKKAEISGLKEDVSLTNLLLELNLASIPDDCIKTECPKCGKIVGFSNDDICWDWDTEIQDYRNMGAEFCHTVTAVVECPECGEEHSIEINVYEYPQGVINYIELESDDLEILFKPDLYSFIDDVPTGNYVCCERCGDWVDTDEIDEIGFCRSCHNDFERFINED